MGKTEEGSMSTIERFEQLHRELSQARGKFNLNEEKRIERAEEIAADIHRITEESKRVAEVAREASVMIDEPQEGTSHILARIKNLKTHEKILILILISALGAIWYFGKSAERSLIYSVMASLITAGIKFFCKIKFQKQNQEQILKDIRDKIKG